MSVQLYKPNSKNSGAAFTFSSGVNQKNGEPTFYISGIAQFSWNEERKIGSFSGNAGDSEKTVNVKLSEFECGEFLSAFANRHDYSTFHSFDGNTTTIKLSPWDKPVKVSKYDPESKGFKESQIKVPAFGVAITKGKGNTFKIALDPGEVEFLSEFIREFMSTLIKFRIVKQKEAFKNRQNNNGSATKPPFKKKKEEVSENASNDDEDEPPF
tara:strand:+ start:641 stop:1276 length:636 start_codon:yes stop_codon:yes gene_type:complete